MKKYQILYKEHEDDLFTKTMEIEAIIATEALGKFSLLPINSIFVAMYCLDEMDKLKNIKESSQS